MDLASHRIKRRSTSRRDLLYEDVKKNVVTFGLAEISAGE
jgi:hypothetical protein